MPYTVALPDGRIVEFPDSVPKERAAELLRKQFPAPEAKPAGFSVKDLITSFGQGAVGSTQALTDVAGAGNAASAALERAGEALQQQLSPERQAEIRRQQERAKRAEESGSTWEEIKAGAQSVLEAPLQSTAQALGSFLPYIPTMFLSPAAAALGLGARAKAVASNIAKAAPAAIGTAQGAGAVKGAIYQGVYDAERKDGTSEEEARAKAEAAQDYFGKNIDQILLGGGAGFAAGRFGAERLLTPGAAATAERSMLGRVGTALATDVPTEAFQGGQERFAQNLALQREGRDVPLFQGVAGQATQEGLMGALGSAPVAAIRGPGDARLREEQDRRAEESTRLQAEADAKQAEQAAFRQTPEYLDDLEKRFVALKTTEQQLKAAVPGKADKNDPLAVEERRRATEALREFQNSDEYVNTIDEYTAAYDQLRPRMQERKAAEKEQQRVDRVQAAPQGTQLTLAGEPGAVQDMSLQGQIKSLNQYIGSLNGQIKTAQKANDTQQVKLLQQKQDEARQQIVALFPDQSLLEEARVRAEQSLVPYQKQIETLTQMPELTVEQKKQLDEISAAAKPFRDAAAEIRNIQAQIAKYAPAETTAQVNKPAELKKLYAQLENLGATGEDVAPTLAKIRTLESQVVEQPALFGAEDLMDVKPRGLGDFIADERERVKALRERLDSERAALQRMAAAPQTERSEEIRIRRQTLAENVRNTAKDIQQRNQNLYALEKKQTLLDKLLKDTRTPLVAQGISTLQTQIADLQKKLRPTAPKVAQPRTKLLAAEQEGEFAPRVTDAQLMEQRDRDIAALLDQFLPGALGVKPTQETLIAQGPEGPREVRLTTLGGQTSTALRKQLENIQTNRNNAVTQLFEVGGASADALRSQIGTLAVAEVNARRELEGAEPLSKELKNDLQSLIRQSFTRAPAIPRSRTPNLAEQQYLDAVEELEAIQDETLDTIYAMNKLAYEARRKGVVDITAMVQNNPVMQKGMQAQARVSAAQRRVDELAKQMPELPDLTDTDLETKIDALIDEFSASKPKKPTATTPQARRVPAAVRPPALLGADIPAQIAANNRQIAQLNQEIQYAGKPSGAEKVAALNQMKAERDRRRAENERLTEQYNKLQAAEPAEETGEVAEMRQELATIERTLAADKKELKQLQAQLGEQRAKEQTPETQKEIATLERQIKQFEARANITRQLENARDELKGRIEAAVGPAVSEDVAIERELKRLQAQLEAQRKKEQTPEVEKKIATIKGQINQLEGQREFLPAAGFPSTALACRLKPVPAEDLTKARTAIVAATQKIEDIRKAAMRVADMGPQYFREVATTYQQRIEKENKAKTRQENVIKVIEKRIEYALSVVKDLPANQQDTAVVALRRKELPTLDFSLNELRQQLVEANAELTAMNRRAEAMKEATAEVQRFLNLARLAGVSKNTNLRESLDEALDRALADKEKKEAALADLERKQRMYEQQEAARRGVDLGEAEAEKLVAGETAGYVSGRGKALADKRKDKRSWVISKDSKVKVIKPDQSKKLQDAIQNAAGLVGRAALQDRLAALQKELANLQSRETRVLNRVKDPNKATEYAYTDFVAAQTKVIKEIEALKAQLNIPQIKEARLETEKAAEALKGAPTLEQIAPLKEALSKLQAQLNAYYTPEKAAELQAEINRLREALSAVPVPPVIANIASAYSKATTATKGLPASERVAQMMFETGVKEQKAANNLKTAEAAVTAAQLKANAATQALQQNQDKLAKAEKKLERLKDPAKIGAVKREISGIKLQLGNLQGTTQKRTDAILDAKMALRTAEADYMVARLERLTLNQQMGEHAKREAASITAQLATAAETVVGLQKQLDTAAANEAAMRQKLDKSSAALEKAEADAEAARQAARNAERLAKEKAQTAALDAARVAQDRARAMQTGLGLPGRRIERDTAGTLMTAAQANIRQRMATAETNLSKAIKAGNQADIKKYTAEVEATTRELAQVYGKAPIKTTELGVEREAEDVFAPAPVEGMRLPARREGPAVRYVRGGSKAIMQSGAIKLRAAGLSQEAANAIGLYVAKNKIKGAKTAENVEKLTKEFDALTDGIPEQRIKEMLAEGKRLMGLGPTAELIAKRSAYQEALENFQKLDRTKNEAKTPLQKELAQDALEIADAQRQRASDAYDQAKALYETSQIRAAKTAEKNAVEALFEEADVELPKARRAKKKDTTATAIEAFDEESGFEETPTTEAADEEQRDIASVKYRTIKQTGKGLQVQAVTNLVKRITSEWALVPDIEIVETESGLPVRILKQAQADKMSGRIPGLYDPKSGKVFLVAANLHTPNDVLLTVAHEVAGHFGLRSVMGAQYAAEMDRLYAGNSSVRKQADAKMQEMASLDQRSAVEEVLAEMAELDPNANAPGVLRSIYNAIKSWVKKFFGQTVSDKEVQQIVANARRQVVYGGVDRAAEVDSNAPRYRTAAKTDSFVGRPAGTMETLRGNLFGLAGRVQYVDRLAAADKAFVEAQKTGNLSSFEAQNAQYFMRLGDMATQAAGQFITTGPVRIVQDRLDGRIEERYASEDGATLVRVAEFMDRARQAGLGTDEEVEDLVTVKIAGDRANAIPRGWERLFADNPAKAKAQYDSAIATINANPEAKKFVDAAVAEYKRYNDGLMDFAEQTGFITPEEARRLKKSPYIPYYRIENGVVKLFVDRETPMVIGNLKDSPDLQQLMGDNQQILPLLTSAVQNTFMLTRMGLRNKAVTETASALEKAGFVTKMGEGMGLANLSTVHYKYKGKPYFATIDADQFGIPADLIVKGMEGIKTTIPDVVRVLGFPANWLRKFITRSPAYAMRQLVRDPLNAAIVGGVNGVPVLNALKQLAKMTAGDNKSANDLMRGLVVSSNIYTGDERDMQQFLEAASSGRGKWSKLMGTFDQLALASDAATRTVIYEDSIKKGLSRRQAEFRALESQNFSRRGLSPSMQMLATLVPFFNAQVQGLDALYRSFRGDMPFSEKLDIQKKIAVRGTLLLATAVSYAFMMRNNDEYNKATPEERYANFFVPLPGVKDMVKVPIPYEAGLLFKALPEAIVDAIWGDTKAKEAGTAIGKLIWQSAPGVVPAAVKPVAEAIYGQTLVGPIESPREKQLPAGQRFREATPEVVKVVGSYTGEIGLSPLMLEHLIRGYTSTLGISALRMLDPVLGGSVGEKASQPLSKMPFFGGLFQTPDGRFLIERAYSRMEEINQAVEGYKDLMRRGRKAEADEFAQRKADLLAAADMAGMFRQKSGQAFADERAVRADPSLTKEQKDALIEKLKAAQQSMAKQFYKATERA